MHYHTHFTGYLDILNIENKDYDSNETCDCCSVEISDATSAETSGSSSKQIDRRGNRVVGGCESTETGHHLW